VDLNLNSEFRITSSLINYFFAYFFLNRLFYAPNKDSLGSNVTGKDAGEAAIIEAERMAKDARLRGEGTDAYREEKGSISTCDKLYLRDFNY
jgi:hypothetical protein